MQQVKVWTKAEALPVLREAFEQGKLAAQNGATFCAYRGPQGPCAIGLLIDDETAARWDDSSVTRGPAAIFKGSCQREMRSMFAEEDHSWFSEVQNAHDLACSPFADTRAEGLAKLKTLVAA